MLKKELKRKERGIPAVQAEQRAEVNYLLGVVEETVEETEPETTPDDSTPDDSTPDDSTPDGDD